MEKLFKITTFLLKNQVTKKIFKLFLKIYSLFLYWDLKRQFLKDKKNGLINFEDEQNYKEALNKLKIAGNVLKK